MPVKKFELLLFNSGKRQKAKAPTSIDLLYGRVFEWPFVRNIYIYIWPRCCLYTEMWMREKGVKWVWRHLNHLYQHSVSHNTLLFILNGFLTNWQANNNCQKPFLAAMETCHPLKWPYNWFFFFSRWKLRWNVRASGAVVTTEYFTFYHYCRVFLHQSTKLSSMWNHCLHSPK